MQDKFKLNDALIYLKQGEIIKTLSSPVLYFRYQMDKILAHSDQSHFHISLNDFMSIYEHETFTLHQTQKEEEINLEKDLEYYQWWK